MSDSDDDSPLYLPLSVSGLPEDFIQTALANGFHTLADFLDTPLTELRTLPWLPPQMLEQLVVAINNNRSKDQ